MSENCIYLNVDKNPKGDGLLAVMTQGCVQYGDKNVIILTLKVVPNMKTAKKWFKQMKIEQPWEVRN